jgi:hypothetical protein
MEVNPVLETELCVELAGADHLGALIRDQPHYLPVHTVWDLYLDPIVSAASCPLLVLLNAAEKKSP